MEYVDLHSSMWSSKHLDQFSDAHNDLGLCVEEMMKTINFDEESDITIINFDEDSDITTINFDEDSDITAHSTSSRNQAMTF